MKRDSTIFVAGHKGLVGSAVCRLLEARQYKQVLTRTRQELDLTDSIAVLEFFRVFRPEFLIICAAKVGGILAHSVEPVAFLRDNMLMQLNLFEAAKQFECKKVCFLGSSCIYPKDSPVPVAEDSLLSGKLEPTNENYAIAKIAGIRLGQAYRQQYGFSTISLMPTNLYGPGDNFDTVTSHVLPALIRKFHEAVLVDAPSVQLWGTGTPYREFLHSDDLADAILFLMDTYDQPEILNVGTGQDIQIHELAHLIAKRVGFSGKILFDSSKPDGVFRKQLDISRIRSLGWAPKIGLKEGIQQTYEWFTKNLEAGALRL